MTHAAPVEVAPGVHRLAVPLPFPPHEVAAWVIEGDEGHTLVDSGLDTPTARGALRDAAERLGVTPGSLAYLVLTHAHLDHCGLAERVRGWSGARAVMHEREAELVRRWVEEWEADRPAARDAFVRAGVPADAADEMVRESDRIHRLYQPFRPDVLLRGERGPLPGGGGWEWILAPGHSPGHVLVHHPRKRLLIAGDHVLPRISPNVGADHLVEGDPLSDYLASLRKIRGLPVDLVLPSHGEPFEDLAGRIDDLLQHHAERNDVLLERMERPTTAWELVVGLFGRRPPETMLHAFREGMAHLIHLEAAGAARRVEGAPERWTRA